VAEEAAGELPLAHKVAAGVLVAVM